MKCLKFKELIDDYLDQQLTGSRKTVFETHQDECPSCADLLKKRQQLLMLLTESARDTNWRIDLVEDVMKRISLEPLPEQQSPLRIPVIAAVLTGLVVTTSLIIIALIGFPSGESVIQLFEMFFSIIEPPESVRESLSQATAFLKAIWITLRYFTFFLYHIIRYALRFVPFFVFPLLFLGLSGIVFYLFFRNKTRNNLAGY